MMREKELLEKKIRDIYGNCGFEISTDAETNTSSKFITVDFKIKEGLCIEALTDIDMLRSDSGILYSLKLVLYNRQQHEKSVSRLHSNEADEAALETDEDVLKFFKAIQNEKKKDFERMVEELKECNNKIKSLEERKSDIVHQFILNVI